MSIITVRNAENDYAALNEIVDKLGNFGWNNSTITDEENNILTDALKALEKIRQRVYTETLKVTQQYIKTA